MSATARLRLAPSMTRPTVDKQRVVVKVTAGGEPAVPALGAA
jgi:hypothetical protein